MSSGRCNSRPSPTISTTSPSPTTAPSGWSSAPSVPTGHDGDWWQLNPEAGKLLMRKCACDWNTEIDAQVAINRLDDGGEDMSAGRDRPPLLGDGRLDQGHDRLRHGARPVLPGAPRDQRPAPVPVDTAGWRSRDEAGLLRRHPPDRRRRGADRRVPGAGRTATTGRSSSPTTASRPSTGSTGSPASTTSRPASTPTAGSAAWYPNGIRACTTGSTRPTGHGASCRPASTSADEYPEATVTKVPVAEVLKHLPAGTPVLTQQEREAQLRHRRHRSPVAAHLVISVCW